jgi:hypothetical protein
VLDTRAPAHTISKQAALLTAVRRISPSGRRHDLHASAASAMVGSLKDQVRRLLAVAPLEAILSTPSSATHATGWGGTAHCARSPPRVYALSADQVRAGLSSSLQAY